MIKNTLAAAVALFGIIVFVALSPVSASSSFETSSYLPDQVQNQAKDVEPMINTYGDTGLPQSFPVENQGSLEDAAPQMYS
jgi:hypothetical protein